ncbi:hypothetical protein CR513_42850, partial [Mucuna pruriens]
MFCTFNVLFSIAATSMVNISAQIKSISMLNGTNFKVWKEVVATVLGCTDSDLALWVEKPILTPDNLQEKRFGALFLRVKGKENMREYIMEMSNLAAKLKSLKLESGEDLIVHLVLILLLTHFGKDKWSLSEFISLCARGREVVES